MGYRDKLLALEFRMQEERMAEYKKLKRLAAKRGWRVPGADDRFGEETWINYWRQCDEYERSPEAGRPVAPHRPA